MGHQRSNHVPVSPLPVWYERAARDLAILQKAARHLRRIAWLGLFLLGMFLAFGFLAVGPRLFRNPFALLFVVALLTGFAALCFALARSVERGNRVTIVMLLVVVCMFIALTVLAMVKWRLRGQVAIGLVIFETVYLIFHFNQLKLMIQSWSAAQRIQNLTRPPVEALPADDLVRVDGD